MKKRCGLLVCLGALFSLFGGAVGVVLADTAAPRLLTLDIGAQPLGDALAEFGRQSDLTMVFYDDDLVRGVNSQPLSGKFTAGDALNKLLSNTGLRYECLDARTIAIRSSKPKAVSSPLSGQRAGTHDTVLRVVQTGGTDTAAPGATAPAGNEIVVKGVKDTGIVNQGVIPRQANEAVRYDIIDREAITRSGATSLPELFRSLSSNATMGTNSQLALSAQIATSEGIQPINDTVNLRGLGSGQTLIMVNGRRLFGGENTGADLARIPVEAIERIELLPTSGSAIYGANAVGGVINIISRKDYVGSDLTAYYGMASDGAAAERRLSYHNGARFNEGRTNFAIFAEAESKDPLLMRDRRYYENAMQRITPGNPYYMREIVRNLIGPLGTVASGSGFFAPTLGLNIPADPSATYAAVPLGSTGVGLTPDSFNATANAANISGERMDRATLLRGLDSYSAFATLEHSMRDGRVGAYAELSWRYADTGTDSVIGVLTAFRVASNNPLNPFRAGVTPGFTGRNVYVFIDPTDLPRERASSHQQTLRAVGGLKGRIELGPERVYNWAIDVSWDRNNTYARNESYTRNLAAVIGAGLYNPFRDLSAATPISGAELANYAWANIQRTDPEIGATNWRVNGDLFRAWGGPARFSLGLEARFEYEHFTSEDIAGAYGLLPGAQFPSMFSERKSDRRARAAYLEVVMPLVGEPNRLPLIHELELVGAVRMERYSDFGSASPPMVGIKYAPVRDLILRASYSEGFQPPTQTALFQPLTSTPLTAGFGLVDPLRGFEVVDGGTYVFGGNPDLRPETSETWDAGVIYSPSFVHGLTLSASYFRYDKFDVVGSANLQTLVDDVPARIGRADPLPTDPPGTPGPINFIDGSNINMARQFVDGWDFKVDYSHEFRGGRILGAAADATKTGHFRLQRLINSPPADYVGERSFLFGEQGVLRWRGKTSLWLQSGGAMVTWNTRYYDSYITDTTTPTADVPDRLGVDGDKIPSTIEHDLAVSYTAPANWSGMFGNTRWTAGVLNVFDRDPPPVSTRISMWYSNYNDPRQRVVYLQMRKAF